MSWFRNNIANFLTCLNLSCGFGGICVFVVGEGSLHDQISTAAFLILLAGIFDFFDGFVARLLKSNSNIGKDLDSLADMVTFGALPGVILFSHLVEQQKAGLLPDWAVYSAFFVPVSSAIRLAIFNNDTRQTDQFIGLPTPANAFLISFLFRFLGAGETSLHLNGWFTPLVSILCSAMLVMPVPLIALKFKDFTIKNNLARFILIGLAIGLFSWLKFDAIPLIIILYIALSVLNNWVAKK